MSSADLAGEVRVEPDTFDHRCPIGSGQIRRGPWTCPICRTTWTPEGKGAWRSDGRGEGEMVAVLMRYDDDYKPTPRRMTFDVWWLYVAFIVGVLSGLATGVFLW